MIDEPPEGAAPNDLPPLPAVFAPLRPEEIAEIAAKLRNRAGLPAEPTGIVANGRRRTAPKSASRRGRATRRTTTTR